MFWKCLFFCQIEVIVQFFNILFICPHKASHDGAIISSTSRHYKSAEREKIGKNVFRLKPRPSDVLPQHWRTTVRRKFYHLSFFFNQWNHSFVFSTGLLSFNLLKKAQKVKISSYNCRLVRRCYKRILDSLGFYVFLQHRQP